MLPVAFEEFEVVYMFFATFFFSLSLSIGKRTNLAKIWGMEAVATPSSPVSTDLIMNLTSFLI